MWQKVVCGSSGGISATELWVNTNPSAGLGATTITLSGDMTNYDYLKVTYLAASSVALEGEDIVSVEKFIAYGSGTSNASPKFAIGKTGTASDDQYVRFITYASNTSVETTTGRKVGASNTSTNACIPIKIEGLKVQ